MKYFRDKYLLFAVAMAVVLVVDSCKKDEPANPFDDPALQPPGVPLVVETLSPTSFAYLHKYIFKATCANSGCHDGTFEPDYRTIYSTYNTLVYHPTISNDTGGTFTYRVLPGNATQSILHERLTAFLPNSSGVMPLAVDPGSDWTANKATYIQNITNWINNGAIDMYGNAPTAGNLHPEVIGIVAFQAGTSATPYSRISGSDSPIGIPSNNIVDIWFAINDDVTNANQMTFNQYRLNSTPYDFSTAYDGALQIESPITEDDLWGTPVPFTHKVTVDLSTYPAGSYLYIRAYIQDADHNNPVELPNDGSSTLMLTYFTLKII